LLTRKKIYSYLTSKCFIALAFGEQVQLMAFTTETKKDSRQRRDYIKFKQWVICLLCQCQTSDIHHNATHIKMVRST